MTSVRFFRYGTIVIYVISEVIQTVASLLKRTGGVIRTRISRSIRFQLNKIRSREVIIGLGLGLLMEYNSQCVNVEIIVGAFEYLNGSMKIFLRNLTQIV